MKKLIFGLFFLFLIFSFLYSISFIYCPKCGVKNAITNNYCSNCGFPLREIRGIILKESGSGLPPMGEIQKETVVENNALQQSSGNYRPVHYPAFTIKPEEDPVAQKLKERLSGTEANFGENQIAEEVKPSNNIPPEKKKLLSEIESIFESKPGPKIVEDKNKETPQEKTDTIKMEKVPQLQKEEKISGGKLVILLTYNGDEIDKYDKYGKVYLNGKEIGKIYRFLREKKGSGYANYFSKPMGKYVKYKFLSEIVYKFEKDGIPPGVYTVKVTLKKKIVWGYSKTYSKKWKAVKVESGIVTKLIYQWNDVKDFGE